jgi:hypothetical protein
VGESDLDQHDSDASACSDDGVARHRAHIRPGRSRAVLVRLSTEEQEMIATAARTAGLTPSGFTAHAAILAAKRDRQPNPGVQHLYEELAAASRTLSLALAHYRATTKGPTAAPRLDQLLTQCTVAIGRVQKIATTLVP